MTTETNSKTLGFRNFETASLALYVDNDRAQHEHWIGLADALRNVETLATEMQEAFELSAEEATIAEPFGSLVTAALARITWGELAEHIAAKAEDIRRHTFADTRRYKIVRGFRDSHRKVTILRHLTITEAQAHCKNPETSSSTCTKAAGKARTRRNGPWFDGYTEE